MAELSQYEADRATFEGYDAQVVGISVDSRFTNNAWQEKELGGLSFIPLLSDACPPGAVSRLYGIYEEESCRALRTNIIVDKQGIVRFIDVHVGSEVPDPETLFEVLRKL